MSLVDFVNQLSAEEKDKLRKELESIELDRRA